MTCHSNKSLFWVNFGFHFQQLNFSVQWYRTGSSSGQHVGNKPVEVAAGRYISKLHPTSVIRLLGSWEILPVTFCKRNTRRYLICKCKLTIWIKMLIMAYVNLYQDNMLLICQFNETYWRHIFENFWLQLYLNDWSQSQIIAAKDNHIQHEGCSRPGFTCIWLE